MRRTKSTSHSENDQSDNTSLTDTKDTLDCITDTQTTLASANGDTLNEPQSPGTLWKMWHTNPRMSMSFVQSKGLLNAPGENNCFLNSAVQVLWHLDVFRRSFRQLTAHFCMGNSCIFCALKVIFTQFQYSDQPALPPDALRKALAKTFQNQQRYQLGLMDDAAECFENILMRIHTHLVENQTDDNCNLAHCISHQKFSQSLVEQLVCECGATSEPNVYNQTVQYVSTSALCNVAMQYNTNQATHMFGQLLKRASGQGDVRNCPSKCGRRVQLCRKLTNCPEVLSVGLIWETDRPSPQHIQQVVSNIGQRARLTELFDSVVHWKWAEATDLHLVGVVCYYGKHYSTFFFHSKKQQWILFDDATVKTMGSWDDVASKCYRGNYQPLLLLYASPCARPVPTDTAPTRTVYLNTTNNLEKSIPEENITHSRQGSAGSIDRQLRPGGQSPYPTIQPTVQHPGPQWGQYDSDDETSHTKPAAESSGHQRQSSYLTAMELMGFEPTADSNTAQKTVDTEQMPGNVMTSQHMPGNHVSPQQLPGNQVSSQQLLGNHVTSQQSHDNHVMSNHFSNNPVMSHHMQNCPTQNNRQLTGSYDNLDTVNQSYLPRRSSQDLLKETSYKGTLERRKEGAIRQAEPHHSSDDDGYGTYINRNTVKKLMQQQRRPQSGPSKGSDMVDNRVLYGQAHNGQTNNVAPPQYRVSSQTLPPTSHYTQNRNYNQMPEQNAQVYNQQNTQQMYHQNGQVYNQHPQVYKNNSMNMGRPQSSQHCTQPVQTHHQHVQYPQTNVQSYSQANVQMSQGDLQQYGQQTVNTSQGYNKSSQSQYSHQSRNAQSYNQPQTQVKTSQYNPSYSQAYNQPQNHRYNQPPNQSYSKPSTHTFTHPTTYNLQNDEIEKDSGYRSGGSSGDRNSSSSFGSALTDSPSIDSVQGYPMMHALYKQFGQMAADKTRMSSEESLSAGSVGSVRTLQGRLSQSQESLAVIEDNTKPVRALIEQLGGPIDSASRQIEAVIQTSHRKEAEGDIAAALASCTQAIGQLKQRINSGQLPEKQLADLRLKHSAMVTRSRSLHQRITRQDSATSSTSEEQMSSLTPDVDAQTSMSSKSLFPASVSASIVRSRTAENFTHLSQRRSKYMSDYVSREDYFAHHPPPPQKPAPPPRSVQTVISKPVPPPIVGKPTLPPKPPAKPTLKHSQSVEQSLCMGNEEEINIYATLPRRPKTKNRERSSTMTGAEQTEIQQVTQNRKNSVNDSSVQHNRDESRNRMNNSSNDIKNTQLCRTEIRGMMYNDYVKHEKGHDTLERMVENQMKQFTLRSNKKHPKNSVQSNVQAPVNNSISEKQTSGQIQHVLPQQWINVQRGGAVDNTLRTEWRDAKCVLDAHELALRHSAKNLPPKSIPILTRSPSSNSTDSHKACEPPPPAPVAIVTKHEKQSSDMLVNPEDLPPPPPELLEDALIPCETHFSAPTAQGYRTHDIYIVPNKPQEMPTKIVHSNDEDLKDFCVVENADDLSSSGIERTDTQSDTSSVSTSNSRGSKHAKPALVKNKKYKPRKSVTFSENILLIAKADEVVQTEEPDYMAYVQQLLKRSPGKQKPPPVVAAPATKVEDSKTGYDSDFDEDTDDSCSNAEDSDKIQCNLCRKRFIDVGQMYCVDCSAYMAQLQPKT